MPRMIYDYTKNALEQVSVDQVRFTRELRKAARNLLPYEFEQLQKWLDFYTEKKPELKQCVSTVLQ
jgi:DNA replication protein DnaD